MKLRYFVLDGAGQLRKAPQKALAGLWDGRVRAMELGSASRTELRLVSVLCDNDLQPQTIYLLRVPLTDGQFSHECYLTLQIFTMRDCVTPREVVQHHGAGWPADLLRQLAVVLDVPLAQLQVPVRVGGPLLVAAAMGVDPRQTVQFLR